MAINIIVRFGGFTNTIAEVVEKGSGDKSVQLVDDLRKEGAGATGKRSAAFGRNTLASGEASFAEGENTIAQGAKSHAEGSRTSALQSNSHAEGYSTTAGNDASHAEGSQTTAAGLHSHAEGQDTQANGDDSHAEGRTNIADGIAAHAEGNNTIASGDHAHAEGGNTKAIGENSHAEGNSTLAEGDSSHAGGTAGTRAVGFASFAHGSGCRAMSKHSVAMGVNCVAGNGMSDEGGEEINTDAFAMGKDNAAEHKASAVFGGDNRSSRNHQMVVGHDNADNANALFIVGNGASKEETQRSNAFEVLENGNATVAGQLSAAGVNITSVLNQLKTKVPANLGGIVCLTLGNTMPTATAMNIINTLGAILVNKQHYIVTIYDLVEDKFFGDCEVVQAGADSFNIIVNYTSTALTAYTIYYSFKTNTGAYTRNKYSIAIASEGSVTTLKNTTSALSKRIESLEQGGTGGEPAEPVRTTLQELYQNAEYEEYEDPDDFYIHVNECIAAGDTDHLFKHLGNFYVIIEDKLVCVGTENAFNTADLNFILGTIQEQVDVLSGEVETQMPFEYRSGETIMDILNRGGTLSLNEVALIAIAALFNSRYAGQNTGANIIL